MIKIVCVGKIKEKYFKDAINEYIKRIGKYTKLEIIEINDLDRLNITDILKKEGESILKHIKDRDYVVTLEIEGIKMNSIELASKIDNMLFKNSNITFVIGGSYGLSDEVKNRSNFKLSFSDFTFPHQLFRVILLEQIYRSFKINNN